ncbi:MAG: hypothetical protein LBC96_01705 [Lachnospiraceae bacterium]|jgi:hypothetical protein|nr:hypothetical protein [Lachnospiraceae bacterium]
MKKAKKYQIALFIIAVTLIGCGGFGGSQPPQPNVYVPNTDRPSMIGMYDSVDTAVVTDIDLEAKTVSFINFTLGQSYTLSYDSLSAITDRHGFAMSMAQVEKGEIMDVHFLKSDKLLVEMKHTQDAFTMIDVNRHDFNEERGSAVIGNENFRLHESAVFFSDGRQVMAADIIFGDIVTVRGFDREIWSVNVERGHGYLRLINDAYAIGGWIEVDSTTIHRITDNMLLPIAEGTVQINISSRGLSVSRRVVIERNRETIIDLGDEQVSELFYGMVLFHVTPATASVFINGTEIDISRPVELEFGLHQVVFEAPGFETISRHIRVSEGSASISIAMDTVRTNVDIPPPPPPPTTDSLTIGANRVFVDAPLDVEVYQNSVYMGVAPVFFDKIPGSHTITLRRDGYIPKSYQIYLENDDNDITYSFSPLERLDSVGNNTGTNSGTDSSSNNSTNTSGSNDSGNTSGDTGGSSGDSSGDTNSSSGDSS